MKSAGHVLGLVGGLLGPVGGLFGLVGLLLGSFGAVAGLPGGGASLVGPPLGLGDDLGVAPFVGQLGRFLRQVGSLLRPFSRLLGALGPLTSLLGQVTGVIGQPASLVGLFQGAGLGVAVIRLGVQAGVSVQAGVGQAVAPFVAEVVAGVTLVLHRMPGHAVRFAGLGHPLAGGDLPGLVRRHDRFFPGETARVCSPW